MRSRIVELSLPRLDQTFGQLSFVKLVLRPGPTEKDQQIVDCGDYIAAFPDRSRFSSAQEPVGEPAVDGFAAGLVVIVGRVYLNRGEPVLSVEEFVNAANRRVF